MSKRAKTEIIDFSDYQRKINPVLRKGDIVRYVESHPLYEGKTGIVLKVCGHGYYGQAEIIDIAFPSEDGWNVIESVEVNRVHRCIGPDSRSLRKKTIHAGMEWESFDNE
jgi:hypothetical protein